MTEVSSQDEHIDDGKEEIEIELSDEALIHLDILAAEQGVSRDQIIEDILRKAVDEEKARRTACLTEQDTLKT
jgi:metal-responsive CopG/Arc/MetJ family transcriptional regulator